MDGLFCWQRSSGESIPGCTGTDSSSVDYCIPKSKAPAKKLKMFWDNYFWQETYTEAFWCMTCTECETLTTGDGWEGGCKEPENNQCEEGHLIWIMKCRDTRNRFEIIENKSSGNQIRIYGTNLCFSTINGRWLELKPCDNRLSNQLWTPFSDRNKFELRPYSQRDRPTNDATCLSQLHHPKGRHNTYDQGWLHTKQFAKTHNSSLIFNSCSLQAQKLLHCGHAERTLTTIPITGPSITDESVQTVLKSWLRLYIAAASSHTGPIRPGTNKVHVDITAYRSQSTEWSHLAYACKSSLSQSSASSSDALSSSSSAENPSWFFKTTTSFLFSDMALLPEAHPSSASPFF
mmetsp:Transcript_37632/g.91337  ORF Transcript_37632/g.91337 Transcript_37632/m.91337 type:complete len:347 (-) Transcript_37632:1939-2979(-)